MLDTPGTITMYFFRKTFNDIDKEPTAEQFKTVGIVSDISAKLGLDITASNISSSITSSYYLGFTKISVIFKYDKNTGIRTIEKDTSLLVEDYIDIGIDNTIDLTAEDYFVICNVTKNTKATNSGFTDTTGMDFLFMIPSSECQEIITDFDILDANNKTINVEKYGTDATSQGYRIYPVMNISDHTTEETTFNPKYYLGTKYQRNLSEILSQGIKSKRTIFNLKDMYLVDDLCIQTLKKINILLENNQMIKLTERLYNLATPLREKLNADLILEYLSTPVSGSSNSDIAATLKTSLIEDYNFTQDEIDNLNDNINTFKSRARISLNAPVVQGQGLDQLRFTLPKTFIDSNRSKTEKKNLLVFGTDAGFNKFGLSGYNTPYSNVSKRDISLDYTSLVAGLPNMSSKYSKPVVDDKTFIMYSGSLTEATGKTPTLTGVSLSTTTKKFNDSSIYINNSFITIPAGANLSIGTKDFTVETWINPTSIVDVPIFTLGLNQSQCGFIVQLLSNGSVEFRAGFGNWGWNFASSRTTVSNLVKANTWNHIVTQRRNGNLEIYINGILYYTGVWDYNIPNGNNLYVGGYVGGSNITAYYDDISISNGVGRYTSNFTPEVSDSFKDILTNYKQQIPFTYIPMSTDAANTQTMNRYLKI